MGIAAGSTKSDKVRLAALVEDCRRGIPKFTRVALGWTEPHKNALWRGQRHVLDLLVRHKIVVVPSGNSTGKTRGMAVPAAIHYAITNPGARIVVVGPTHQVLADCFFTELRKALAHAPIDLGGKVSQSVKAIPQTWQLGDGWYCIGMSCTNVDAASGRHAEKMLVIVDEASGVPDHAWEAIYSWKAEKMLVLGNPLRATGEFPKLFKRSQRDDEKAKPDHLRCVSFVISSTDSPHIHLEKSPCGLADKTFLDEVIANCGRDSKYWREHVELDKENPFPTDDYAQIIPTPWIDALTDPKRKQAIANFRGPHWMSVDVSKGSGRDRTVIMIGTMAEIVEVYIANTVDIPTAAGLVRQFSIKYGIDQQNVVFDAGGWAGSEMRAHLAAQGMSCREYRGNDSGGDLFANKRSFAARQLRMRLDPERPVIMAPARPDPSIHGILQRKTLPPVVQAQAGLYVPRGPWWSDLREELMSLREGSDGRKMALERKEDLVKRLGRSPDLADCLIMGASIW